ncbi:hypothetical protein GEMRC1_007814 [Eukaryota sp. GEM-RC1]
MFLCSQTPQGVLVDNKRIKLLEASPGLSFLFCFCFQHHKVFWMILRVFSYSRHHSSCLFPLLSPSKHHKVFWMIIGERSLYVTINQQSSQFAHDLTTEGDIESNPGPFVTEEGITTLKPSVWLDDSVVDFYGEYITESSELCQFFRIGNLHAAVSYGDFDTLALEFLNVQNSMRETGKRFLFIPINDGVFRGTATHWTLLVCDIDSTSFFSLDPMYTDSSTQLSFDVLTQNDQVLSTLQEYLRHFGNFSNLGKLPVIKQQTPNDCGPFILMYMQRFVHLASTSDNFQEIMFQVQGYVDYDASEMRKQVLNLIASTHPIPFAILAVSIVHEYFSNNIQAHVQEHSTIVHSTPSHQQMNRSAGTSEIAEHPTVVSSPDETRQVPLTIPNQLIDSNRTRKTRQSRKYPPKKKKFSQKYQILKHQHRGILTQSRPRPILLRSNQIDTLKPNVLLHDSVIDFVGQYIAEKSNLCEFFEVANIQDAINLSQYNIMFAQFREVQLSMEKSSKRHTQKCKKRFLFIPIHDGLFDTTATYWSLLICDIQNKQYFSIDSMCTEDQHSQISNTFITY